MQCLRDLCVARVQLLFQRCQRLANAHLKVIGKNQSRVESVKLSHRFEITLIVNTNDTISYHMLITTYQLQWLNKLLSKDEKRI